ncbi:MAG TPA: diguanylate cyclase [Anaeromyxobacteraceae bacterium]|nr:diguanylate cyclase [Anaeromyxobacteraceae bacterium]
MSKRARILVVDDSRSQLEWLVQVLDRDGYEVLSAANGGDAIKKVKTGAPDLVLLDKVLPDMDGLEVLRIIKARPVEQFVPVIILSAKSDLDSKVAGLKIGADDYLAKPFAEAEILARAAAMLRIKHLQDELRDAHRTLQAQKKQLQEQSLTDALTGLRNRRFFDERLQEEFHRAQRYSDPVSLMMIDLDHFKLVNDRWGHPTGDAVLHETAAEIRASLRDPDICARYGGEEFAVILPKTHLAGALAVAERVWRALAAKANRAPDGGEVRVTASIGIAFYPSKDITTAELLLRFADEAMYRAKSAGRNTICLYQAQSYRYEAKP